jgi:hypothetical protein
MDEEVQITIQCVVATTNFYHLLNANKYKGGGLQLVNLDIGICDLLD